jgi:hypothetical protein
MADPGQQERYDAPVRSPERSLVGSGASWEPMHPARTRPQHGGPRAFNQATWRYWTAGVWLGRTSAIYSGGGHSPAPSSLAQFLHRRLRWLEPEWATPTWGGHGGVELRGHGRTRPGYPGGAFTPDTEGGALAGAELAISSARPFSSLAGSAGGMTSTSATYTSTRYCGGARECRAPDTAGGRLAAAEHQILRGVLARAELQIQQRGTCQWSLAHSFPPITLQSQGGAYVATMWPIASLRSLWMYVCMHHASARGAARNISK